METLELKKQDALKAYNEGDSRDKSLLERLYGKQTFSQKITDRVKTFEDACKVLGINAQSSLPDVCSMEEKEGKAVLAFAQLSIIRRALNEGWQPDYSNSSQYKYYPWMKWSAGSGFSFHDYDDDGTISRVGARLTYKTRELAEYAATQFKDLYNDLFTL